VLSINLQCVGTFRFNCKFADNEAYLAADEFIFLHNVIDEFDATRICWYSNVAY